MVESVGPGVTEFEIGDHVIPCYQVWIYMYTYIIMYHWLPNVLGDDAAGVVELVGLEVTEF